MRVRFATYNVHRCIGRDGREDPSRIAAVLAELNMDVVGLQEVGTSVRGKAKLFDLVEKTGMRAVAAPLVDRGAQWQGNALLSRHPILNVERSSLSVRGREPRGVLDVTLEIEAQRVRVMVVHFGLQYAERKQQVRMLLEHMGEQAEDLLVVMGDFNEWFPRSWTVAQLDAHLCPVRPRRSFPTRFPLLSLDRIWMRPKVREVDSGIYRSPITRLASDHFPVWVDIMPTHGMGERLRAT